jgi:hypothetical protein
MFAFLVSGSRRAHAREHIIRRDWQSHTSWSRVTGAIGGTWEWMEPAVNGEHAASTERGIT